MKKLSVYVTGVVGLSLALVLTGCGSKNTAVKQDVNLMEPADIESLNSTMITDVGALETVNNTQEGLYRLKNSTVVEPGIAKKLVKPTNNGKRYTFKLRQNLKWSNGDPITAQDFVFAWRQAVNPATKAANAYQFLPIKNASQIEKGKLAVNQLGVKAINKTTFQVDLAQATPYFKYLCAGIPFLPQDQKIVQKYGKAYGTSSTRVVYDGPFVVKNWTTSSGSWTLKKNPNYWDSKNVKLKTINFQVTKSPQTALSLYQSGKLDNITLSGQQASQEKDNKGYQSYPSGETDYLAFNYQTRVLRNPNIRKAISLSINRQQLVNNVLKNGAKAPYGMAPQGITKNPRTGVDFAKDSSVKQSVAYNPKLAAKYWQKGMRQLKISKMTLNLVCYDVDTFKNSAEFIQASTQKYLKGLKVNIEAQPKVQAITTMQKKKGYDLGFTNWIASYPDLSEFYQLSTTNNVNNAGNYSSSQYDTDYKLANGRDSNAAMARYNDFKQANQTLMNDQAVAPLNQGQTVRLNNPQLKGVNYAASQGISLKNAYMSNK